VKKRGVSISQRQDPQIEKMGRLVVNAQVTAMITFCESIGQFIILFVVLAINSKDIGALLFCMLHLNFLPIAFLVNTRKNKGRVLQQGWFNAFRQSCRSISFPRLRQNKVLPSPPVKYNVKNEICTISQIVHKVNYETQEPKEYILACDPNNPMDKNPSTSKGCSKTKHYYGQATVSSTSSISSPYHKREFTSKHVLNEMLRNIDDEKVYISLFMQLTDFEDEPRDENEINNLDIRNEETIIDIVQKLLSKGSSQCRVSARKKALQKLIKCYNEQSIYKTLLEKLISIEENFLNDDC
jgi:hypothetical protein